MPARRYVTYEERRRTQRVLLRVHGNLYVSLHGKSLMLDVTTLSVSPHGALVVMQQPLPMETRVILEHSGTREKIGCKVVRPPQKNSDGYHVPLEFDSPAPDFWKIDFPPADWRPDDL